MVNKRRDNIIENKLIHTKGNIYKIPFRWDNNKPGNRYFIKTNCTLCGNVMYQDIQNSKKNKPYCSKKCIYKAKEGANNHNWTGGRKQKSSGHILVYSPNHPNAYKKYVPEHRLIIEQKLGAILKKEERVHHINMQKDDNRPDNLIVVKNQTEHNLLHWQFIKLIQKLMKMDIILFDKKTRKYYLGENVSKL